MPTSVNKHGLARSIPEEVKRQVRQRCGYGCVVCGSFIYEYDHFHPEFREALDHDPEGIVLLCPNHHAQRTSGIITKSQLIDLLREPFALKKGYAHNDFPYFHGIPTIKIGTNLFENCYCPILSPTHPILLFREPEDSSNITRINANFTNKSGLTVFSIVDNEWQVHNKNVLDFEFKAKRLTVKSKDKTVLFKMTLDPPNNITLNRLIFKYMGHEIRVSGENLSINSSRIHHNHITNCNIGMRIHDRERIGFASNAPIPNGHLI